MTPKQYKARFAEPTPTTSDSGSQGGDSSLKPASDKGTKEADTRAGRALAYALDIRKFEIELYWKRATYFWAFIAAAFAGYALTYKNAADHEPWLSLLFSALGLLFSVAWYLVNRGSKFWQNNWERHVDILEDMTLGPLYKIIATNEESNIFTAAGQYSVTKINQLLSLFTVSIWVVLFAKSIGPIWTDREVDGPKIAVLTVTVLGIAALGRWGKSNLGHNTTKLTERTFDIEA